MKLIKVPVAVLPGYGKWPLIAHIGYFCIWKSFVGNKVRYLEGWGEQ